ncbi:MAG: SHOCT domain-containing protein [Thermomicrobiales bacterium]
MGGWPGAQRQLPRYVLAGVELTMMGYYQNGWNWVAVVIMMAFMFLFMAGVVAVIVYAIRGFARGPHPTMSDGPTEDWALSVLRERYARGEIDHTDYEERHKRLMTERQI